MADIATELASKAGISPDAARKGLGVVLGFLKNKLPAESFSKVSAAVPGADNMMTAAADMGEQDSGGVVGAVKGAVGKIFGGGTEALISKFGQLGLSADQIAASNTPFDDADLLFEVDTPVLEVWQQRVRQAWQWVRERPPYVLAAGGGLIVLVLLMLVLWLVN